MMNLLRPRAERGPLPCGVERYGESALGAPLLWFPATQNDTRNGLIIAGIHGDEHAAIVSLSCALRSLVPEQRRHHTVLAVNPDGCQLGLRANAHGVDLNRNFPAANWRHGETVYRWNSAAEARDVVLSTGEKPASEPETHALCQLVHRLRPAWVVSFHAPLGCIEDPHATPLGHWMAQAFTLPRVTSVGYETPGAFGSWCEDLALTCVTAELPPIPVDAAIEHYLDAMIGLLRWQRPLTSAASDRR